MPLSQRRRKDKYYHKTPRWIYAINPTPTSESFLCGTRVKTFYYIQPVSKQNILSWIDLNMHTNSGRSLS